MKPIVTVKEARKILGKKAEKMTDHEIQNVVKTLHLIAKDALEPSRDENKNHRKSPGK